jgi:hypothetical protein
MAKARRKKRATNKKGGCRKKKRRASPKNQRGGGSLTNFLAKVGKTIKTGVKKWTRGIKKNKKK